MQLFLVRHGETDSNRSGLALGRADVPLNDAGLLQARCLGQTLSGEPIATVYASPLRRAMDTAREIAATRAVEVQVDEGLIEMDIGQAEGLTFTELRERFPELLHNWAGPDGPAFLMPGGERLVDVQERAWATVQSLLKRHQDDTVCSVTHNFVILSVLAAALGVDLANFRRLRHSLAAIAVIDFRPDRTRVLRMNDTCHLDSEH